MNAEDAESQNDEYFMGRALELARSAAEQNEVPVGAVVVRDGVIIGEACNAPIGNCDPCAHAEVLAIRRAAENEQNYRIPGATLYVTIEPCTMCLGAIVHARIARVVFGALEPKAGMLQSNTTLISNNGFNHYFTFEGGILAETCSELISDFFKKRRENKARLKLNTKL